MIFMSKTKSIRQLISKSMVLSIAYNLFEKTMVRQLSIHSVLNKYAKFPQYNQNSNVDNQPEPNQATTRKIYNGEVVLKNTGEERKIKIENINNKIISNPIICIDAKHFVVKKDK